MKVMIVGAWVWPQYELAFARGLRENDVEVVDFVVSAFFRGLFGRMQQVVPVIGPALISLNRAIIVAVEAHKPDLVLFWRPTHILPGTIRRIEADGIHTASYNNDDPFGPGAHGKVPWHHHFLWCWYTRCLPFFSWNFFYRKVNCFEAKNKGASHVEILLPYFLPWQDTPVDLSLDDLERFKTDVVFVGHYEGDGRADAIISLIASGVRVKVWGSGRSWSRAVLGDYFDLLAPIVPAEGGDYGKALCGATICLCFLSKINRDTYTRRCFEIPAYGRVMLAERTDDLLEFFEEDKEACFFSSKEELVEKVQWLIDNPDICQRIARAGMNRVWLDKHDVFSRARFFLSAINRQS